MAQKQCPTKGDYCELVAEDFKIINKELNENAIIAMSNSQYKNFIKKHIKEATFKCLSTIQASHVKVRDIKYNKLEAQEYIISPSFTNSEITTLAALRSHTTRGIKGDFSS